MRTREKILGTGLGILMGSGAWAQVTQRVSVATGGAQGNGGDSYWPSISVDGRYVAFGSGASNLVPGDTNGYWDVFVRDRRLGTTERLSIGFGGFPGNGDSVGPSISADGRYVAFVSGADNLVPGDTNGSPDAFVSDRQSGTTERVSVGSGGAQGNDASSFPSISADGRYVAFESLARNLVPGDSNGCQDIFVRDRQSGTTERVSVDAGGAQGNRDSEWSSISADGRYVAFESLAENLVPGDSNGWPDVFVRDRQSGTIERVSTASGGVQGDGGGRPSISADGRYVAFYGWANNLVPGDTNSHSDVFVHDRQTATTERTSVATGGTEGNDDSYWPSISADGRYVAFYGLAINLVGGDTNGALDIFVHDRQSGTTERVSVDSGGVQGNGNSSVPSISVDGRYVAFFSSASNLVGGDTNLWGDVFIRDRHATGFTSLCDPGVGGVIACPCSNPPAEPGRGCDNSASTGGASLSASGVAYLSTDSLVFTTSDERSTALSLLTQWTGGSSTGSVYGQGVRCTSGTFKRLYTKSAVGGSITAPAFGAGDPTVSARSTALGNVISPGESRWYFVYYRDPNVLGGCPASNTFNVTQTGQVSWQP